MAHIRPAHGSPLAQARASATRPAVTLHPAVTWHVGGTALDARLLPLLAGVASAGSLATAAKACGVSYRAAWDLLARSREALGVEFVAMARGRGARLTAAGEALLAMDLRGRAVLDRELGPFALDDGMRASSKAGKRRARIRLAASHDLALERLLAPGTAAGDAVDIGFSNSLQALATFARGDCDLAGFHVAVTAEVAESPRPFLTYLDASRDVLIRFADRDQGLIVPRGNPKRLARLEQVARRRLRFVTRQRGSGTRLLVEALLARSGLRPSAIEGYGSQAATHHAVAEAVASGEADVGFGLAAAARDHGLDFVPVTRERYFLAARREALDAHRLDIVLEALRGRRFARIVADLAGYHVRACGTVERLDALSRNRPSALR